jgi:LacI family transcriptional regulator
VRPSKKANQLYEFIRRGIETGKFRINERIPTERELATQFGMSRPTASGAIQRLVKENIIRRNGKAGSIVIAAPPRPSLTFGAILIGLATQHREETVCDTIGKELSRRAALDKSFVLLQDPSWSEDPGESGVSSRYRAIADEFLNRRVSGVFLMPQEILADQFISPTASVVQDFQAAGIPVILIDRDIVRYPELSRIDLVGIDNFEAAFALTRHFIEMGCRRLIFLAHTSRVPTQESRIDGYLRALGAGGLRAEPGTVCRGNLFDREFVVETLRRRRPDAAVVVSDSRAASVMRFALDCGIDIPHELRLGSFDDLPMSSHLPVPLTTIRQPAAGVAAVAMRTMLQRIDEPQLPPVHAELHGELIIRESSGAAIAATNRLNIRQEPV